MKERMSPWQVLFYVSWSAVALWLILKMTGVINTPFWLEYGAPIAGVLIAGLAHYQHIIVTLTKLVVKVEHLDKDVDALKQRTAHL